VMAIILSSSDSAPLSSVVICWNIVVTTLNMSFRDKLFALGAWTDWLGACCLCLKRGGVYLCNWGLLRLLLLRFLCVAALHCREGLEENALPVVVLGALCDFLFRVSSFACLQPLDSWRDEIPLRPPTWSCSMSVSMLHCSFPDTPCATSPHHIQLGGCLQLAQTWPNFW
jgi:hypothetical protein